MTIRRLALALLLFGLVPATAFAQGSRLWHVGFGGGVSVPAGDFKDVLKTGAHGRAFVGIGPASSNFGTRLAVNYQHFDLKGLPVVSGAPTTTSNGSGNIVSGLANLTYGINFGILRPYLTAGLGAFDVMSKPESGSSTSDVKFGVNGGAGVSFKLGQIRGFVEGRYENLFTDKGLDANATNSKDFAAQVIPVTFGVMF